MLRLKTSSAFVLLGVFAVSASSCGPAEIRIDQTKGVPNVAGSTEISLASYTCGQPIAAGSDTVQTRAVTGGCELSYDRDVPVLKASDYQSIPELKGVANLVQRIELTISKLTFKDGNDAPLDLNTQITSAVLSINGQAVADKAVLGSLPKTISLQGEALTSMKTAVDARQPATVRVRVVVGVPTSPAPPAKLKIDYDAQPAVILGPGKIF